MPDLYAPTTTTSTITTTMAQLFFFFNIGLTVSLLLALGLRTISWRYVNGGVHCRPR